MARPGRARSGLTPRQLPAASPVFTGRAGELTELTGLPDAGTVVIGSIDGMAGIGKTALAVQAAQRLAAHYPDGQLFLDLHGFTPGVAPLDPADALERMLRALGVPGEWIPAHLEDRSAMLRSTLAGRRVLLLLDNAADDVQVRPLLPGTPGCLTLITSRHRLAGLDDAHLVSVGVLSLSEAADLFARAVRRDDLTARSPLVSEIVDMCGRLPLAIRIAAARLRAHPAWTAEQLIERLGDHDRRLAELHAGQRSMGAALDMSYRHLTARHRRAYRLLGLHPGAAFGTDAAAALTGMPRNRAEEALDDLLEAQLLDETAPGRYTFHDLVRLHAMRIAREEEREPDRQDALARLLDHYTRTASLAVDVLYAPRTPQRRDTAPAVGSAPRPATPPQAAAWLDAELANLLAAAEHAADHDAPGHVLGLSRTLQLHLHTRGHFSHAETLHERARDAALQTGDRAGEMWATIGLADAYQATIRLAAATEGHERALALAREIGDRGGELAALRGLGRSRYLAGRNRPPPTSSGRPSGSPVRSATAGANSRSSARSGCCTTRRDGTRRRPAVSAGGSASPARSATAAGNSRHCAGSATPTGCERSTTAPSTATSRRSTSPTRSATAPERSRRCADSATPTGSGSNTTAPPGTTNEPSPSPGTSEYAVTSSRRSTVSATHASRPAGPARRSTCTSEPSK
ncbi:NB-ARC domain-containing protein [Actinomadura madurae]|nr:tetratricopeptide repeat protein [Actinomadura madurae]MCP9949593.1 NB-ARC domain-containing protein [Actinomadura madurae]